MSSLLRWTLVLAALLLGASGSLAQDSPKPLVVFIGDDALRTPELSDPGPNGLSQFTALLKEAGARVETMDLTAPLPEDTHTIVLVGPRSRLSSEFLARMWVELAKGKNLLLVLDPAGEAGGSTDDANSGISRILTLDFGVGLLNGFIVEPWFTSETVRKIDTSFSLALPDAGSHPVIAPLLAYQIPVQVWGARPLDVEPFGIDSVAASLLYAVPTYAEADTKVFQRTDPTPLEISIGTDVLGRVTMGALAENSETGGRIAVLADSEMLRNNYGLRLSLQTGKPIHLGNYLLTQRLIAWLLDVPMEEWSPLPEGFTWIALDGVGNDWTFADLPIQSDHAGDAVDAVLDVLQVRTLQNDDFLYLLIDTAAPPTPDTRVDLEFDLTADGLADKTISLLGDRVFIQGASGNEILIPDADMTVGDSVEARIPVRAVGFDVEISRLCVTNSGLFAAPDCVDQTLSIFSIDQADPSELRFPVQIAVFAAFDNVSVYSGLNVYSPTVAALEAGQIIAATGRDETGQWIQVQEAGFVGWMQESALTANGDLSTLPVKE